MDKEPATLTFNFHGDAAKAKPQVISEDLRFRAGFTPNYGDVISFEGTPGAFLVHSREFQVKASGAVDVVLNLMIAKPAN